MTEYDAAADAWVGGPQAVYARLAAAALDRSPVPLRGASVLDVGAGTAVAAGAALAAGARHAVAADVSIGMLRRRPPAIPAVVADAAAVPFGAGSFDLVTAAFCLSHLPDPVAALTEWRRVAPTAVVTAFAPGPSHPAKDAVDGVMERFGFVAPDWYRRLKGDGARVEEAGALADLAGAAGYRDREVATLSVDTGLHGPEDIVAWRLGMAHLAPFVAGLSPQRRAEARATAESAVAGLGPVLVAMQVLSAR